MGRARHDRGQVVPLAALALLAGAGTMVLVAVIGGHLVDRARAQAAADAGALAAAWGTDADAVEVVEANGAVLVTVVRHAGVVEVEVRVGRSGARARAERRVVVEPADPIHAAEVVPSEGPRPGGGG